MFFSCFPFFETRLMWGKRRGAKRSSLVFKKGEQYTTTIPESGTCSRARCGTSQVPDEDEVIEKSTLSPRAPFTYALPVASCPPCDVPTVLLALRVNVVGVED